LPQASAESSLELDRGITRAWLAAAPEVIMSHASREDDRELTPSALIAALPLKEWSELTIPAYAELRDVLIAAADEELQDEGQAPGMRTAAGVAPSGAGTNAFRDQAACPFRAFAVHRLGAEAIESPGHGLDASARGTLVHALFAGVWQALKTQARLKALVEAELVALLDAAADTALGRLRRQRPDVLRSRLAALEKQRLIELARAWLELEKERPPFEVALIEEKQAVSFGGLTVNARLDRLDRVRIIGGDPVSVILDYKTGRVNVGDWLGHRPDDPQLPLYAVAGGEAVGAVAFAAVKTGEMRFRGLAGEEGLVPGVRTLAEQRLAAARAYRSWEDLLDGWRQELEALGRSFVAGDARVDPKHGDDSCGYCGLRALCRIDERASAAHEGDAVE
jgi:probable DNA repair protein